MTDPSLVRPLFEGPVDVVGDVHGEIDALNDLLARLGYGPDGTHPEGRRLVFVGDLVDRGPDTPAVLRTVRRLTETGRAQCVAGNHELALLHGTKRAYNHWFHGKGDPSDPVCADQRLLPSEERTGVRRWIAELPLALERADLRVVHACWHGPAIELLRAEHDAARAKDEHRKRIQVEIDGQTDEVERNLAFQNRCPVKRTTSGPEHRASEPFFAGERMRCETRAPWWQTYPPDAPFCVFGHYSRTSTKTQPASTPALFPADPEQPVGSTMCIDLGVGGRAAQRRGEGTHETADLAAFRWPERTVIRDRA